MGAMSNDPAKLAHFTGFCTSRFFSFHPLLHLVILLSIVSVSHFRILALDLVVFWLLVQALKT